MFFSRRGPAFVNLFHDESGPVNRFVYPLLRPEFLSHIRAFFFHHLHELPCRGQRCCKENGVLPLLVHEHLRFFENAIQAEEGNTLYFFLSTSSKAVSLWPARGPRTDCSRAKTLVVVSPRPTRAASRLRRRRLQVCPATERATKEDKYADQYKNPQLLAAKD